VAKNDQAQMSDQSQSATEADTIRVRIANAADLIKTLKEDLQARVLTLESHLGFANQAEDLAVRVAKLEKFVGIAG
jgi:hypothetical protein